MVKDVKDKEQQLIQLQNEINSKTKLINLANQQLPAKEARNTELDKMIKEKEARLKEIEDTLSAKQKES